jgi:hypothetical protein
MAHPVSYTMGSGGCFPGVKRHEREAYYSPPSTSEIKNVGAIPPLPHTSLWLDAYLIKLRDIFTFTFYCQKSLSSIFLKLILDF